MADIATISLKADTSDLERGTQKLKELGSVAETTSSSVDNLNQSVSKSANSHQQASKSLDNLNSSQKEAGKSIAQMHAEFKAKANAYRDEIKNIKLTGDATEKLSDVINRLNIDFKNLKIDGRGFVEIEKQVRQAMGVVDQANSVIVKSFMDQIDATRRVSSSTSDLTTIQKRLAEARREGSIGNQDYLEILSQVIGRTKELSREERVNAIAKDAMMTKLKEQAFLYGATKTDIMAYRAAQLGISEEARPVINAIKKQEERTAWLAQEQKRAAEAAKQLAQEQRMSALATARDQKAKDDFINSLKQQTDIIGKTRTEILELKAAQMGISQQAAPFIAKLKEQEKAFMNGSITIGQYKQAMRQLPMQMTDIVTSLASGMPVWMVMIQQGGQIKDSFGGIGNSLKAVTSLITPVRIAMFGLVGAASAVAIAAYKGSIEFGEYNRQLILTGGYAGKTASQLDMLSRQLSGNGITQYRMADTLSKVVGSGLFAGNAVEMIANTAAQMEVATGQSVDETIKQFSRLKNEPVSAILELNKTMHFLKSSELERIMRLEEMGHKDQAAAESMTLLSKASLDMAKKVKANLGTLERAWKAVSDAAKDAWDQMLSVGREVPLHERLNQKTKQLEFALKELEQAEKSVVPDKSGYGYGRQSESFMNHNATRSLEARRTLVQNLKNDISDLQKQVEIEDSAAAQADRAQKREEKRIASLEYREKSANEWATNEKRRALELADLWRKVADAPDLWSREYREAAVNNINKKYKPEMAKKGKEYHPDYGTRADESANQALLSLQAQLKVLKEHKTVADVISSERKKLWDMEAKITILEEAKKTRQLTKDEQSLLLRKESILASQRELAIYGDKVSIQQKLNDEIDKQRQRTDELKARGEALIRTAGLSSRLQQREIAFSSKKTPQDIKDLEEYYAKEDSIRANWELGVKKGFAEFQDQATDVYGNVAQITQSAFQGMSNTVADFFLTSKFNLTDFTKSFLEMTTKMITQMAMLNAMRAGLGGTTFGNFLGLNKFDSGGYTGDGGKYDPKGVVHGGEFVFTREATQRLGIANLYRLMESGKKGYATGGYVGSSAPMSVTQPTAFIARNPQIAGGGNVQVNLGAINIENGQQQQSSNNQTNSSSLKRELQQMVESGVNNLLRNPASVLSRTIKGN